MPEFILFQSTCSKYYLHTECDKLKMYILNLGKLLIFLKKLGIAINSGDKMKSLKNTQNIQEVENRKERKQRPDGTDRKQPGEVADLYLTLFLDNLKTRRENSSPLGNQ